jgi:hypothetical protein
VIELIALSRASGDCTDACTAFMLLAKFAVANPLHLAAGNGHSVTSGFPSTPDGQFCSPNNMNCDQGVLSNQGFVYEFTFAPPGSYSYFLRCALDLVESTHLSRI